MKVLYLCCGGRADLDIKLPTLGEALLMAMPMERTLSKILDVSFSMEAQVTSVAISAFYHLRLVRQLVPLWPNSATVTSRMDYCNSLCRAALEVDPENSAGLKCGCTCPYWGFYKSVYTPCALPASCIGSHLSQVQGFNVNF